MARYKLEQFRNGIREYLESNTDKLNEWISHESSMCRSGLDIDVKRDNVCYGLFFHLSDDLKHDMKRVSEWQDIYIANIMISVVKEMGIYENIQ